MPKATKKNLQESAQTALLDPDPPELAEEQAPEPPGDAAEPENETPPAEGEPEDWRKRPREGYRPRKDDDETIFDKLNAMDSWEGVWVYVYRIQPFSNRLMGGNRKIHVKRYDTPFDVQDLMLEAGSGVYQFQATRQDPKTGKRPMFATGEVKILNVNHPPKIPVGEWVDDPRNKEWQWAKEAIMKQAIIAAPVAPAPPDPLIGILEKTIDRQEAAMQALRAEMTASAKAAADAAAVPKPDPAAGVMAILAPFLPAIIGKLTAPPPDPMASLTAAITLLKSVTPPPAAAPIKEENALTALETHIELTKKLEEVSPQRESRQRSRMEGWQEFTQGLVHELAPVLQPVVQIVAMTIAQKQREAAEEAAAKKVQQPGARPQRDKVAAIRPPSEPEPQPEPAATGPKVLTDVEFAQEVAGALEENESGELLAAWYVEEFGIDEYTEAKAQGKEKLLADIRAVSQTKSALATFDTTGALDKLITEFLAWVPETPEGEEETPADPQPAAAAPVQNSNPWIKPAATVETQQ